MYPCKECSFVGTQNNALKKHVSLNHKKTIFECDRCPYVSIKKESYKRHIKIHEGPQFACNICDKKLAEQSTLRKHIVAMHGRKLISCISCDSQFENIEQLKAHKLAHVVCQICIKTFSRLGNLNQHLKTHSGKKNFQCNLCYQSFSRAYVLKNHAIIHSEIKPFKCEDCDKSFKRKEDLKEHQKRKKARQCDICGVPFGFRRQLEKHKEEKHNDGVNTI